ncbi:hypothetical protein CONLIGDRAFT_640416 [Coniochaeta ligniaria NRRL 30616]|uniref:Integral membrane protein n=1 Tax=Coniochaeta ligniaria NRRL 30616 TaxID=1408157 RepID=A0A1J7IZS2_9PEZI|nr:hypothetical protein CONLIGDRAFT_640416 [Coniochaeta ligniaria NRRL 30616]
MEMRHPELTRRDYYGIPDDYTVPGFPSLYWPPEAFPYTLVYIGDIWRFTFLWTIIIYAIFHLGATSIALAMQVGKTRSNWKYMWVVPIVYGFVAGFQAMFVGSVVGLV